MSRIVYSTDQGRLCPQCEQAQQQCRCKALAADAEHSARSGNGVVRICRETKGRKGKGVSIVSNIPLDDASLKKLKDGQLEFQGDQRQTLKKLLEERGYTVKLAGG